jgi:hypothetical protein
VESPGIAMNRRNHRERCTLCFLRALCLVCVSCLLCVRVVHGSTALPLSARNAQTPSASPGSIQGIVVRAGTIEPLGRAVLELRGDDDDAPPLVSTTTEADGRFSFRNLRSGRYRLAATRPGSVSRPMSITVSGGRTEEVTVAMAPTGAISGRVYGQNGEPLGNIDVAALKSTYQRGRRVLSAVQSVRTNDRGDTAFSGSPRAVTSSERHTPEPKPVRWQCSDREGWAEASRPLSGWEASGRAGLLRCEAPGILCCSTLLVPTMTRRPAGTCLSIFPGQSTTRRQPRSTCAPARILAPST